MSAARPSADLFAVLARHLRPGGRACVQTITVDEALFERNRRSNHPAVRLLVSLAYAGASARLTHSTPQVNLRIATFSIAGFPHFIISMR